MSSYYLPTALRRALEKAVKDARVVAEEGARDAISRLGVAEGKAPGYLSEDEKDLRRRLRAHARALGDAFDRTDETQETKRLVEAAAYAHWHRMLFARFLAERGLLRNPEFDVAVTLEDCRELAEAEGLTDPWAIAERYSAAMLPAVFRIDDPVLSLDLDPVHTQKLHRLVTGLDAEVFQAEESLGWTYQFWRTAEKDAVNKSGVKIGADELPAVTQLFTEPYMVRFLLHNTLGAWWAGKVLAADPSLAQKAADEDTLRAACSLPDYSFDMLRFVRVDEGGPWRLAAGNFPGWPTEAKAITMLDPCCGSGHFLTEALAILTALRQAEEGLSPAAAVVAVLADNLHGLEIDGRCVQIAAFAVALTAWQLGGWQGLPLPHIAWVGAPPPLPKREFIALADDNPELEYALAALFDLFALAPTLGSLLEPAGGDLFELEKMREIERLLEPLLARARSAEPEYSEGVIAARGMADAAQILHRRFVLQSTNVPYLGRGKQGAVISAHLSKRFRNAQSDLATAMLSRMIRLTSPSGTIAAVTPQNWLFLSSYKEFRLETLQNNSIDFVCALGPRAFETISGEVVNTALFIESSRSPEDSHSFTAIDANSGANSAAKELAITSGPKNTMNQSLQKRNPDYRITATDLGSDLPLLERFAESGGGISTFDSPRFFLKFWEKNSIGESYIYCQSPPNGSKVFSGRQNILRWQNGKGDLARLMRDKKKLENYSSGIWEVWSRFIGRSGVCVGMIGDLPATPFDGYAFDNNTGVIIPNEEHEVAKIWQFVSSTQYSKLIRKIDQKLNVTSGTLVKVPIDISKHLDAAVPEPYSQDPRQWLFHGHPANSEIGTALHAALSRLCGYRWPAETDTDMCLSEEARSWIAKSAELPAGDNDGLLGVPAVAGENPLADRLRAHLATAFGADWSDALERRLVAEADETLDKKTARDGSLDAWVRDRAFRQHCALFDQRPFLWHISDGLKDGFSVFVHYHRFDQANLRKLTYTLLGDWLARAKAENNALRYEKGRELQQMLEKILEGEKPYDIFVRWKSLSQKPLGWDPDLDDGVRQNIRPFIKAGVLTHDLSKILKDKDRGKDVTSAPWYPVFKGERRNDHHTTLAEKRSAREAAVKRVESAQVGTGT